jgi:hypothetical protein
MLKSCGVNLSIHFIPASVVYPAAAILGPPSQLSDRPFSALDPGVSNTRTLIRLSKHFQIQRLPLFSNLSLDSQTHQGPDP